MSDFSEWMAGIDAAIPTVADVIIKGSQTYDELFNPDVGNPSVPAPAPTPQAPALTAPAPATFSTGLVVAVVVMVLALIVLRR